MTDAVRTVIRGLGQLLITAGLVVLLFCVYELWGTGLYTSQQQTKITQQLQQQWADPVPRASPGTTGAGTTGAGAASADPLTAPTNGKGIAIIRIPKLGRDYAYTVVEGVDRESLKKGPGHLPESAQPGALGNFVVSGHRTTYLAPFNRVDELQAGDPIVVETRDTWFTYEVTQKLIVLPTAYEVTYPVPGDRTAKPTEHLITLTTCNPKYSAKQRLVLHGRLVLETPKTDGPPPALRG